MGRAMTYASASRQGSGRARDAPLQHCVRFFEVEGPTNLDLSRRESERGGKADFGRRRATVEWKFVTREAQKD